MNANRVISTLDYHTAGEPLRILRQGTPAIPGDSMLEKRRFMQANHDDVRKLLMLEPRGHADMYGAVITEPVYPGSDCGVLFMHNAGYSTMCGHGIIALVTAGIEHKLFDITDTKSIKIDTPAGLVEASAEISNGKAESVSFLNVPSFVQQVVRDISVGERKLDATVAFGGAWYAYVDASDAGVELEPAHAPELISMGRQLKASVNSQCEIHHPDGDEELNFLYGVIFVQRASSERRSRNVCVFADGELDRSPTGTGVSGRAAIAYANGEISLGETLTIESILGTTFTVQCVAETRVGNLPAVLTRVKGQAYMTGEHQFTSDKRDPLQQGFFIR
jgi:proline racemase